MDKEEAQDIMDEHVEPYRKLSYDSLSELVNNKPIVKDIKGRDEVCYQIELRVFWDDKPGGNIRFLGSLFASSQKTLFCKYPILRWIPLYCGDLANDDFILSPQGEFIGE